MSESLERLQTLKEKNQEKAEEYYGQDKEMAAKHYKNVGMYEREIEEWKQGRHPEQGDEQ